jgi:hypothetical protein
MLGAHGTILVLDERKWQIAWRLGRLAPKEVAAEMGTSAYRPTVGCADRHSWGGR